MVNKRIIRRRHVVKKIRPIKADKQLGTSLCEKHFWIFVFGVILILILTRVFDFSLKPASYRGLFINRPYCGLHSWAKANRAWAARNHVKYTPGLYQAVPYPKLQGIREPIRTYKVRNLNLEIRTIDLPIYLMSPFY